MLLICSSMQHFHFLICYFIFNRASLLIFRVFSEQKTDLFIYYNRELCLNFLSLTIEEDRLIRATSSICKRKYKNKQRNPNLTVFYCILGLCIVFSDMYICTDVMYLYYVY